MKKAVLVVSFGTSHRETREKNIGAIEAEIARALPDWALRRAFTSGIIREKLRSRDGLHIDSVEQVLERLQSEGFTHVICQPTHMLNGEEYEKILKAAELYARNFEELELGAPLLTTAEDFHKVASLVAAHYTVGEDTVLCLMGHGSGRFADCSYAAMGYHLWLQGHARVLIGAVEGYPDIDALVCQVKASGAAKVLLAPFMVVAGDHAVKVLAGEGEDSWKSVFLREGFEVECVLKGLGEMEGVQRLYAAHALVAEQKLTSNSI